MADQPGDRSAAELIEARVAELGDWRGEALARARDLVHEAVPGVVEELKWRKASNPLGVPVWSADGIICTFEIYKDKVKLTFARGASLDDPAGLFNASLEGNTRRAIDLLEGDAFGSASDSDRLQSCIERAINGNGVNQNALDRCISRFG